MGTRAFTAFLARHGLRFVLYGVPGAILTLLAGILWLGVARVPDLEPWHVARLDEEFTRADVERIGDFAAYRALEERLFAQLRREVHARIADSERHKLDRFSEGSLADPATFPENGNRSFERPQERARAGVLLVHGLSDSPRLLRALADRLHAQGAWVVGLRLPGHGTAPAALTGIRWQDWAAAVRMGVRHVRARVGPDVPVHMVGFSTGAALAVEYALARLEGEDTPRVDGLVLLSPAIGVDPLAWLAVWQSRLSALPGLGKLAWLDVGPEYDPHKYNSFPVNAGRQIYELTCVIDERLSRLEAAGPVRGFPRTLIFQSVADATVSPQAVIEVFVARLAPEGHEVVAFDLNRWADAAPLLRPDGRDPGQRLREDPPAAFDMTLLTNADPESLALVALRRPAGGTAVRAEPTQLAWPKGVFSLSHLALPVPPDDPLYGAEPPARRESLYLGRVELLGEQGRLAISPNVLVRLRFNPFFDYLWERMQTFLLAFPAAR